MAGGGGPDDENPVAINVTAMVDVIFCLCVFFMCSMKFKQLEGKFDTWLPKGKGDQGVADSSSIIQEIRVILVWNEAQGETERRLGIKRITSDEELQAQMKAAHDDFVALNRPDAPVTIDADPKVPWSDVIKVVNICKRNGIDKIEFALGAPSP